MSLRVKTFTAIRWTSLSAIFNALFRILQVSILARLLSPADYGLMAIVFVILGFANIFSSMGLGSAYVQRKNVSEKARSSLYWLNILLSIITMLIVMFSSPLLADIYGNENLTDLIQLSAVIIVIGAISQQIILTSEKQLQFRPIVLLEIAASAIGFLTTLFLALIGYGVHSLVYGAIVSSLVSTLIAWLFLRQGWLPKLTFQFDSVKSYLKFGGAMVGDSFITQFNKTVDLLLGGKMLIATQLGLYSVPRNLMLQMQFIVNPIVTRVGFPLIAKAQDDILKVKLIYLKTINMVSSINAPLYIGAAFYSHEVVEILFGSRWLGSADLLQILAIWGFFRSTQNPIGSLLIGMGRSDLALYASMVLLFIVPPIIWFGSDFGVEGLSWSLLSIPILLFIPRWYFLIRPICNMAFMEYCVAVFRALLLALIAIFPAYLMSQYFDNTLLRLFTGIFISGSLYVGLSFLFNREWVDAILGLIWGENSH